MSAACSAGAPSTSSTAASSSRGSRSSWRCWCSTRWRGSGCRADARSGRCCYYPGGALIEGPFRLVEALATRPYSFLAGERMAPYDVLNGLTAMLFVVAVPFVWRRFGAGYGLFMLANLWLPLSSGQYEGLGRYCSVLFPFFLWLATFRSRAVTASLIVLSAMLYTLCLALFTTIHPLF